MKKLLKKSVVLILSVVISMNWFSFTSSALSGVTSAYKFTSNPVEAFTFTKLPVSRAVQNFDFVNNSIAIGSEVYCTQRIGCDTYLSRCVLKKDSKRRLIAECQDYVLLKGYGHGESLECDVYEGKLYLWVGANGTDKNWSKAIARIVYTIDSSSKTGAKVTEVKKITYLRCSTKDGKALESGASAVRTAVSIAYGDDRICFRTKLASGNIYYSVYDLSDVNAYLNDNGSTGAEKLKSYCKSVFNYNRRPNGSFQGFDITGVGADNKFMYITGGDDGEAPMLYKLSYTNGGKCKTISEYIIPGTELEIESCKVVGKKLYFLLVNTFDKVNGQSVYYISRP